MRNRMKRTWLVVGVVACCGGLARAQAVVHALGGTIDDSSHPANSLTVTTDDGSSGSFAVSATAGTNLNFDKDVRAETDSPGTAEAKGTHVILYYVWDNGDRTVVAVQKLGPGPFEKVDGKVTEFNKHDRVLTMHTEDGKTETIQVSDKTVIDTADGVTSGVRFHAGKGNHLRLLAVSKNGAEQALLIRADSDD